MNLRHLLRVGAALTVFANSGKALAQPVADPSLGRNLPGGLVRFVFAFFLGLGVMWAITSFGQWLGARRGRYPAFKKPSLFLGVVAGIAVFLLVMSVR